ncbi:MAG: GAF domain-containing protein [Anaerolineales bacterium]|nr:GAF domain-containing protein [Anaerolineales bacterium]
MSSASGDLEHQDRERLLTTNRRLLVELQALSSRISAVHEIATAINQQLEIEEIFNVMERQAKWLFDFDHFSICYRADDDKFKLITLAGEPLTADYLDSDAAVPIWQAIETNQAQLLHSAKIDEQEAPYSQIIIPLFSEKTVLGALRFVSHKTQYTQDDLRIGYMLAIQLATALRNAMRFKEINQLYHKLDEAYQNLKKAEQARDDLANMVVHDLRSPLSVVTVALEMYQLFNQEHLEENKHSELLNQAFDASQQLNGMIEDLLNLSKLEAGKLTPVMVLENPADFIQKRRLAFETQAQADNKQLEIHLEAESPYVQLDQTLIERVLINLLSNAIKYSAENGTVEVSVSQLDEQEVLFKVKDYGAGIPEQFLATIFEKFVQAQDEKGRPLRKGTGLGLAFCKLAIEAHNGRIWVESQEGQGSTFFFTLPIVPLEP